MKNVIFHIDVNSAFLSWEAVYRLKNGGSVDLREIPSAVGGDKSKRRGIILAKSIPAKAFGVRTGEPIVDAMRKCPSLTIIPSHHGMYREFSKQFMDILREYTPEVEKYSIDEAFMNMTGMERLLGDPVAFAYKLKDRIKTDLGFTVNIGISSNKLLAKMASDFQKPDKVHTLFPEEIQEKMWPLPVSELLFVGRSTENTLKKLGIYTIGDLAAADVEILKHHLKKHGEAIWNSANGRDSAVVEAVQEDNKGYGNSVTLSRDISDYDNACQVLLSLCETVGARLRADHVLCSNVCVELRDWEFRNHSHQMTLDGPTDSTSVLYECSCRLLKDFWDMTPLRLMGVRAGKINDGSFSQISLFDDPGLVKKKEFEKTVDKIRNKYGIDSIKRASFLQKDSIVDHAASKRKHLNRREDMD